MATTRSPQFIKIFVLSLLEAFLVPYLRFFLVFGACGDEILIGEREKRVVLRDGDKMSLTLVS